MQHAVQERPDRLIAQLGDYIEQRLLDHLLLRTTPYAAGQRVGELHDMVPPPEDDDRCGRLKEQRAQMLLLLVGFAPGPREVQQ